MSIILLHVSLGATNPRSTCHHQIKISQSIFGEKRKRQDMFGRMNVTWLCVATVLTYRTDKHSKRDTDRRVCVCLWGLTSHRSLPQHPNHYPKRFFSFKLIEQRWFAPVHTAKVTDWTFTISAITQVINYRLLTPPENILGNVWLVEPLQPLRLQNYRHPVYSPKVVLGI